MFYNDDRLFLSRELDGSLRKRRSNMWGFLFIIGVIVLLLRFFLPKLLLPRTPLQEDVICSRCNHVAIRFWRDNGWGKRTGKYGQYCGQCGNDESNL